MASLPTCNYCKKLQFRVSDIFICRISLSKLTSLLYLVNLYLKISLINFPLFQESIVIIHQLQDLEKHFFELVSYGNVPDVRDFLESNPTFNINVIDFQVRYNYPKRLIDVISGILWEKFTRISRFKFEKLMSLLKFAD